MFCCCVEILVFEHGTLCFHIVPDPGNPHPLLSMGISLSRFNSSPTSSRKPSMIPSQFRDSLLSSISVGIMAHTHHSILSVCPCLCPCWLLIFLCMGVLSLPSGYELTGAWGDAISAEHYDVGQRIIYTHVASLLPNCKFLYLFWYPHSTPSPGSVRWQFYA